MDTSFLKKELPSIPWNRILLLLRWHTGRLGNAGKVGFTSACKAFGHRYLLGFLEQRGLARASVQQL